jgi:hypothetical protein
MVLGLAGEPLTFDVLIQEIYKKFGIPVRLSALHRTRRAQLSLLHLEDDTIELSGEGCKWYSVISRYLTSYELRHGKVVFDSLDA